MSVEARYSRVHNYSFVENLRFIRSRGMPAFLRREIERYLPDLRPPAYGPQR